MSENNQKINKINNKPWMQPFLEYLQIIIEYNDKIEILREKLCSTNNFSPIKLFIYLDFEKNGFLTSKNIIHFLQQMKTNFEERCIRSLIHTYDKDGDFNLNLAEFLDLILPTKNKSLKEKILNLLKEKSDKKNNNEITEEVKNLFHEIIKEELSLIKASLYAIKKIYNSPKFTTYDAFINIVKNESYITKENLSQFLKENNLKIKNDLDINLIMFRIDEDNDNKISYPEFQDIFYPLKNPEMNNLEIENFNYNKKEKENIEIKKENYFDNKLNFDYNIYGNNFIRQNKTYQLLNNNINDNKNKGKKEIYSNDYKKFISQIRDNLEKIKTNKNFSNHYGHIEEKSKIKDKNESQKEVRKINSCENFNNINIQQNNNKKEKKKIEDNDNLISDKNLIYEKSKKYKMELSANISIEKNIQNKKEQNETKNEIKKSEESNKNEKNIDIEINNKIFENKLKNSNIHKNKEKSTENIKNKEKENNQNLYNLKLNEDKNINLIEKSKSINKKEKINQFENLKSQNCFRFAIKNKFRKKFLIRNFSDIQQKNCNNCNNNVFTTMTERILNKSQKEIIKNDKHNPIKKINKFKLNFNSLNLYRNPNKIKKSFISDTRKEEEIDLTNYFKINKSDLNSNHNKKEKNEKKGSKTSRIINTKIKANYLALFELLNNYINKEIEKEKILEKLYLCPDFNLQNLFRTFLCQENSSSFKKEIITANDIYNALINLGLSDITPKDVIYIFIKYNKNINKKEKINNLGFTYEEFCKIMKPKNIRKNNINKKYQKYFMGFSFKTKRIICALFKQIIDSEKLNEIFRRQLINNEKNKHKIYSIALNIFDSLKKEKNDEYLDDDNFEYFMNLYDKKLDKSEKKILMKRFDKNKDKLIDFNEFFNEIIPKINVNLDYNIDK